MSNTSGQSTTEQYDWSEVSPSVAVLETVADLDGTTIEALPPLVRVVDVDALNDLIGGNGTADTGKVVISLQYNGYDLSISSSGWITIEQ